MLFQKIRFSNRMNKIQRGVAKKSIKSIQEQIAQKSCMNVRCMAPKIVITPKQNPL